MTKDTRPDPYSNSASDSELITEQTRIARLLAQLARRHTPLTVRIPGHKARFTSCTVDVEQSHVLLDELMPSTGHELLIKARKLNVSCKLDGVEIEFVASLARTDELNKLLTYYMHLPTQIEYRQRRQHYRVHIPLSKQLRVIVDVGDTAMHEGMLHDLSRGGAGVIFSANDIILEHGQQHECAIELPDTGWLYCTVELRYSKDTRKLKQQLTGAHFIDLHPAQTRLIGRCISELEREFIRKRAAF
ncbi:MAG: flagellar regulator YcgR PilZN domain-containing protein, partial [Gammaproteobacteria bacterium]